MVRQTTRLRRPTFVAKFSQFFAAIRRIQLTSMRLTKAAPPPTSSILLALWRLLVIQTGTAPPAGISDFSETKNDHPVRVSAGPGAALSSRKRHIRSGPGLSGEAARGG